MGALSDFFGHYSNVTFILPYVNGDLDGQYLGQYQAVHPAGFGDPQVRLAVNLVGAPALTPQQFATLPVRKLSSG